MHIFSYLDKLRKGQAQIIKKDTKINNYFIV